MTLPEQVNGLAHVQQGYVRETVFAVIQAEIHACL